MCAKDSHAGSAGPFAGRPGRAANHPGLLSVLTICLCLAFIPAGCSVSGTLPSPVPENGASGSPESATGLVETPVAGAEGDRDATATPVSDTPAAGSFTRDVLEKMQTDVIRINQVGYRPTDRKHARVDERGESFHLVPEEGGQAVLSGILEGPVEDSVTGEPLYTANFSDFTTPGRYRLVIDGAMSSFPFRIGEDAYQEVDNAVLKFFYYQRCGMQLEEAYAGDWKHAACHLEEGVVLEDDSLQWAAPGGWHDAGDYGRYVVNTAVSTANLLLAHDLFPQAFTDTVGIPESGNGVPDVLDEARYALEWMLHMQDAKTGGVYHKLTSTNFPALLLMPEYDLMRMYFSPVSSTATADFAAVLALAARVYAPLDESFSRQCLAAAEKAWDWLQAFDGTPGFSNPPGMNTGEYGDRNDRDERFWAAAELFRTTGKDGYADAVRVLFSQGDLSFVGLDWQEVSGFGSMAWLLSSQESRDPVVTAGLRERWMDDAQKNLRQGQADSYGSPLLPADYGWGSNSGVINRGIRLLVANQLAPNPSWVEAAEACRHYLLGGNVLSQSYLTGFGTKTVRQPHHRPSAADRVKAPVPGMVAGGPNGYLQDAAVKAACEGLPPAACYVDDISSYSANEVAINWNAPAVFLFAGLNGN
jgi:endoglucanase